MSQCALTKGALDDISNHNGIEQYNETTRLEIVQWAQDYNLTASQVHRCIKSKLGKAPGVWSIRVWMRKHAKDEKQETKLRLEALELEVAELRETVWRLTK